MSEKYLEGGELVEVLTEYDGGFVVRHVYEYEGHDEPRWGEPFNVKRVYDTPPTARIEKSIAEVEAKLAAAKEELKATQAATKSLIDERKRLESIAGQNAAIQRVIDFLVTGITHVVEWKYGSVSVVDVKKTKCGDDKNSRELKLISLFGASKGNLEWRIHQYSDGSGFGSTEVLPFTNENDATEYAKKKISELLIASDNHWGEDTVKCAKSFGVEVPRHVSEKIREKKLKDLQDSELNQSKKLADIRKQIGELTQ